MTLYRTIKNNAVWTTNVPSAGAQNILLVGDALLPPLITELHRSFRAWGDLGLSPGPIEPARLFVTTDGAVTFAFSEKRGHEATLPQPLAANTSAARDLAGWLILLDKWMETFVVLARARHVWTPAELGAAIPYLAPIYQSAALIEMPPVNWETVARALAGSIVDGTLKGGETGSGGGESAGPKNKHWQKEATGKAETGKEQTGKEETGKEEASKEESAPKRKAAASKRKPRRTVKTESSIVTTADEKSPEMKTTARTAPEKKPRAKKIDGDKTDSNKTDSGHKDSGQKDSGQKDSEGAA